MSSYFYLEADKNASNGKFLTELESYADQNKKLIYVLNRPLTDLKYSYKYSKSLIILSPKSKIALVDYGNGGEKFENYVEDIVEDIGSISDKYQYKEVIGRPRQWKKLLIEQDLKLEDVKKIQFLFDEIHIEDDFQTKQIDLLISLFIGSINDIGRVKETVPVTLLDKVKQKIQLFDGDQTRFIYKNPTGKKITIQGLSGTGKTELLLHKLKDLYTSETSSKICFTCWNKILADSLRKRIPTFFNFMKVEQQIEWEKRLWCFHAWGGYTNANSGAYRYICEVYQIPFFGYAINMSFAKACQLAIEEIKAKYQPDEFKHAFTYMIVDESQDFDEIFFDLCELVTEKKVYVAGDIFQSIFDETFLTTYKPDFLLGKCYRTDPKTLMFAHALGMGLFEKIKLRWLEEADWKACGYQVEVKNKKFYLSREPIRRFEDLADTFESIKLVGSGSSYTNSIIDVISQIKEENNTVGPEDIAIIFLDQGKFTYQYADELEIRIALEFDWIVNKAYETKNCQHSFNQ